MLIGSFRLTANRVIIDLTDNRLYLCGPGDVEVKSPPGSTKITMERDTQSGHLIVPCDLYETVVTTAASSSTSPEPGVLLTRIAGASSSSSSAPPPREAGEQNRRQETGLGRFPPQAGSQDPLLAFILHRLCLRPEPRYNLRFLRCLALQTRSNQDKNRQPTLDYSLIFFLVNPTSTPNCVFKMHCEGHRSISNIVHETQEGHVFKRARKVCLQIQNINRLDPHSSDM